MRQTTSDTTLIPLLWWMRQRKKRESTKVTVTVLSVMKHSKMTVDCFWMHWQQDLNFYLSFWQHVVCMHEHGAGCAGLLWLIPPVAERTRPKNVCCEKRFYWNRWRCVICRDDIWPCSNIQAAKNLQLSTFRCSENVPEAFFFFLREAD